MRMLVEKERNMSTSLPVHDIPDGSHKTNYYDPDSLRLWPDNDGVNLLGTPLGSPAFIKNYMTGKGHKHC